MSGEAQSFSPTALQPDRLFPIGLVDVRIVLQNENLNVMIFDVNLGKILVLIGIYYIILNGNFTLL